MNLKISTLMVHVYDILMKKVTLLKISYFLFYEKTVFSRAKSQIIECIFKLKKK
jgi:hypothetical protein